jgi:predicted MFS family arabinose efflux permease
MTALMTEETPATATTTVAVAPAQPTGYLATLRTPGALGFMVPGLIGRMPIGMAALGIVLLVSATTGSYGSAGAVSAGGALAYAVLAPRISGLTDRYGQRRVLRPQVALHALFTVALVLCAVAHAPLWTLFLTGGLTRASMPSIGSMVRSRWSHVLKGSPLLRTAFSLESIADELIFISGPVLATVLATQVLPAAGVVASAALSVIGVVFFTAQRGTEPPAHPRERGQGGVLRTPGLWMFLVVFACNGAMFVVIDIATLAFARQHGGTAMAGPMLSVWGVGSGVSAFWFGARSHRASLHTQFLVSLTAMVAGVAPLAFAPNQWWLMLALFGAGLGIAPTLVCAYAIVEEIVPAASKAEGMTWLTSASGLGTAIGAPFAGHLIDLHGAAAGFGVAAGFGALSLLVAYAYRTRLAAILERRSATAGAAGVQQQIGELVG